MKTLFISCITFILCAHALAQKHQSSIVPSGQGSVYVVVHNDTETQSFTDSMYISLYRYHAFTQSLKDSAYHHVPLGAKQSIAFRFNRILPGARLSIIPPLAGSAPIIEDQLMEAGDSVHVHLKLNGNQWEMTLQGRGVTKYQVGRQLKQFYDRWRDLYMQYANQEITVDQALYSADSITTVVRKTLQASRRELTPWIAKTMEADRIGAWRICQLNIAGEQYASAAGAKTKKEQQLRDYLLATDKVDQSFGYLSHSYLQSQFTKLKWQLLLEKKKDLALWQLNSYSRLITLTEMQAYIVEQSTGTVREGLLAYVLLNFMEILSNFGGARPGEYDACLKQAIALSKTPLIRQLVKETFDHFHQGAPAFNWSLPDLNGNVSRLSDLKGKVILLDTWAANCSGCSVFKKQFEAKIYPLIKDRKDFQVVSVCMSTNKKFWKQYLNKYSRPEFVNVYTEGKDGYQFCMEYNAYYNPYLALIDEHGNFICTTERDVDQLLALIKAQLKL